jgi:hypothetical protein
MLLRRIPAIHTTPDPLLRQELLTHELRWVPLLATVAMFGVLTQAVKNGSVQTVN